MKMSRMTKADKSVDTPGRRALLAKIARFQRHPVKINVGLSPRAARQRLIEKLGLSKEIEAVREESLKYARAARKAMADYVASQRQKPISFLESSADLVANLVDYQGKGHKIPRGGMAIHTWDPAPPSPPPNSQSLLPDDFYRD